MAVSSRIRSSHQENLSLIFLLLLQSRKQRSMQIGSNPTPRLIRELKSSKKLISIMMRKRRTLMIKTMISSRMKLPKKRRMRHHPMKNPRPIPSTNRLSSLRIVFKRQDNTSKVKKSDLAQSNSHPRRNKKSKNLLVTHQILLNSKIQSKRITSHKTLKNRQSHHWLAQPLPAR